MAVAANTPFPRYRRTIDTPDDDLTDDHMRLLPWLAAHPTGSLAAAAQALGLAITDVEIPCADLVDAGLIERAPMQ
jgi:DNA-binding IclR family transcriptional regulator